jgi:hypothetical protein
MTFAEVPSASDNVALTTTDEEAAASASVSAARDAKKNV